MASRVKVVAPQGSLAGACNRVSKHSGVLQGSFSFEIRYVEGCCKAG